MKRCLLFVYLAVSAFATEPPDRIGDAWSDARNPVVVSFNGKRLDLWSLKQVRQPQLPQPSGDAWGQGEIDRLVLAHFQSQGLPTPPSADARTLARRLYFDLTGLPPTPEEVAAFSPICWQR